MKGLDVDSLAFVDNDQISDFKNCKKARSPLIESLGQNLISIEESEIVKCFERWYLEIQKNAKFEIPRTQMNVLMAYSILHYFEKDMDRLKNSFNIIEDLLMAKDTLVVHASSKVLYWLSIDIPDATNLFKESVKKAFEWINEQRTSKYINALLIIKSAKKFLPRDIVHSMTQNLWSIFRLSESEDTYVRTLVANVISFVLQGLSDKNDSHVLSIFSECLNTLINHQKYADTKIHGHLLILQKIYCFKPSIFTSHLNSYINILSSLCLSQNSPMALSSFQIINKIALSERNLFTEEVINKIFTGYISKCVNSDSIIPFYEALNQSILIFKETLPKDALIDFIIKVITTSSNKTHCSMAFKSFAILAESVPGVALPSNIYLNSTICKNYIRSLKTHPTLTSEIKQYISTQMKRGLSPNNPPNQIIVYLKMARTFKLQLFQNYEEMHQTITKIYDYSLENLSKRLVKTIACEPTTEAHLWLLHTAVYDMHKSVRYKAISFLKPTADISLNSEIALMLSDPCFRVRRKALELISDLMQYNPFDFTFPISEFLNLTLTTLRTTPYVKVAAKYASLMPIFVSKFIEIIPTYVPIIINVCLDLLLSNETEDDQHQERITYEKESKMPNSTNSELNHVVYRDGFSDPESFISNFDERMKKEPKRIKIFQILNSKYFDKRDMYLLQTLAALGNLTANYLDRTLSAFFNIFKTRKSNVLLVSAVNSLTLLSTKIDTGLNLRLHHQHFIPVLMKLLISTQGNEVSVAILKLFGTACDSVTTSEVEASKHSELGVDLGCKSFYADFTISHLIPYFKVPTMQLFEAVTCIYDSASKDAAKFVDMVIPMFLRGIETFNDKNRDTLFQSLEVITRECLSESTQFLPELTQLQLKYLNSCYSIKLAASLSFHLLSGYISYASVLFLPATRMITNRNRNYFKYLMKFLSFSIMFQDQPFEPFISAVEDRIRMSSIPLNQMFMKILSKTFNVLIQSKDLSMFQSRISLLVRMMIQKDQTGSNAIPLLISLCNNQNLPVSLAEHWSSLFNLQLHSLTANNNNTDNSIIKKMKPKFKLYHPTMPITSQSANQSFFDLQPPDDLNIVRWLDDLCQKVISQSPSVVIRSCATLATTMSAFRQQLFPIAFLSCWEKLHPDEQLYFSQIVHHVIGSFNPIDPFFVQIIELLDRASMPLQLDGLELANASDSRPLTLFFLQRLFKKNPKDHMIIEKLLDLNTTMGRNAAAHGMLVHAKGLLEDATAALWSEKLGEWDKAFHLYANLGDANFDVSSILRCYDHLEMWDKIKEMEESFETWDPLLKEENAKHFAWAYYNCEDYQKVDYYVKMFHKQLHLSEMLFMVFYLLKTQRYEECQTMITKGFETLAKDTSVYIGGDAIRLHKNLYYSQMFIELQESLNILNGSQDKTDLAASIWNKRLKGFKRDSESWIRLIAIRSLVFAPGEYINVYFNMISVLRKERRWNLIDSFFNRFFKQTIHPNIELEHSKILWARGKKKEAIESLKSVLDLINVGESDTSEEFIESLNKLNTNRFYVLIATLIKHQEFDYNTASQLLNVEPQPEAMLEKLGEMSPEKQKEFLIKLCSISPSNMSSCFDSMFTSFGIDGVVEARIYRTLGTFKSMMCPNKEELKEVSRLYEKGKIKNSTDYKIWLQWAYANSRLIDADPSHRDKYSVNAVVGFLRATQLRSSNTLEFLCQMFSIFFRVNDSRIITDSLINDILELPANIIVEIIPQITVQIAHPDHLIRNVVERILMKFGEKHYQGLFYPLKLYEHCDVSKAKASRDILLRLHKNHEEEAADANLFVDGMLSAAISWFEQWIIALDTASKANHDNNIQKMDRILNSMFAQYDKPRCDLDRLFIRKHDPMIKQCRALFNEHTNKSIRSMWDIFKHLFSQLNDRVKRLELILLPKVSEQLATKRGFKIAVPGTYSVLHPVPNLECIEPALQVLGTQQHPRCVFMISSSGEKVKFLLKGNEDIRLDQRVMQFFTLINSVMNRIRTTRELGAQIVKYAIIPLSPNAGLITWVTGADTLHQMISEHRLLHNTPQNIEFTILDDTVGPFFNNLTFSQKLETFRIISKKCEANEIRDALWSRAPNAAMWMSQSLNFTVTTALMSMVGYVIGLGDRHPSNIMVQRETGRVIHIDFGDSFESTILRASYPEMVPFRLTRMIVNALDSSTIEGIFRKTCEDVMWVLRDSKASIVALLEIFVHEPLEETDDEKKLSSQTRIIDRVYSKLVGRDELLFNYDSQNPEMDVESHVDALVKEASDPSRYVRHYIGWCPFW